MGLPLPSSSLMSDDLFYQIEDRKASKSYWLLRIEWNARRDKTRKSRTGRDRERRSLPFFAFPHFLRSCKEVLVSLSMSDDIMKIVDDHDHVEHSFNLNMCPCHYCYHFLSLLFRGSIEGWRSVKTSERLWSTKSLREIEVSRDHFSSLNHDHSIIRNNKEILHKTWVQLVLFYPQNSSSDGRRKQKENEWAREWKS